MNDFQRLALRAAISIREAMLVDPSNQELDLPDKDWNRLQRLLRQKQLAQDHEWRMAERIINTRLIFTMERLATDLRQRTRDLEQSVKSRFPPPDLRLLYEELIALPNEFSEVSIDLRHGILRVVTDEITLEDITLGRFDIVYNWTSEGPGPSYDIHALDPAPSNANSDFVHPHISDGILCEGEAKSGIEAALAQGRFCDFFLIVASTLNTYNDDSAYVTLKEWYGTPCLDCGTSCSDDDLTLCSGCEDPFCHQCCDSCRNCHDSLCSSCLQSCEECSAPHCGDCLNTCSECNHDFCSNCLTDGYCEACYETLSETDPELEEEEDNHYETTHPQQIPTPSTPAETTSP
ncbi:hypothetical protein [Rubinisphaera italica]|uniref:RING-type domain-containing protein n=1 Tax=Rubinisphaera italica TaxID=2527969 RepID=A0A5C5X9N7_9PLAN|nr:hypothetical protein [Rubinisphaera italica]TWT59706.1 hypothetical protein Pan54_04160 [Rubinisphaera italica]